jgi:cyclophilin family peptidyl-prolyl cis-trans isomerase
MSLQGLVIAPFTVAGRINSGAYHKAKAIVEGCDAKSSATFEPLMPTEYEQRLLSLRTEYGGPAFLHEAGVVVYSETAGFIGDDAQLLTWLKRNHVVGADASANSDGMQESWDVIADEAYLSLLTESGLTFAFLELSQDDGVIGRLVFELFPQLAPQACSNFLALCKDGYLGTPIHRIKPGGWLQAGDVKTGNGDGGASSTGVPLPDESFAIEHAARGVLGMVNGGPHTATSQFYVTLGACPFFDRKFVAFGKLVDGTRLLEYLESIDCSNERPRANLVISDAGMVERHEMEHYAASNEESEAATKLQSLTRARNKRKELQERKKAAARVQAAKRGQQARREAKQQKEAATKVQAISRGRKARATKGAAPAAAESA